MNIVQAVELSQQLEELIFVTVNKIGGMRRENAINGLSHAFVSATSDNVTNERFDKLRSALSAEPQLKIDYTSEFLKKEV